MPQKTRQRRRIKLIKPSLQLRLVGVFFGLTCLGGLIQTLHLTMRLSMLASSIPEGGNYLLAQLPSLPLEIFFVAFFLLLPLTMAVGVVCTFLIAGPVYHFEKFLREVADGTQSQPCKLRKNDQLTDLCELINGATLEARERNREPAESPHTDGNSEVRSAA